MSKFIFDADIPREVLPGLHSHFEALEMLVPDWCSRVIVDWRDQAENSSATAQTFVNYHYRWARITIYASFLIQREPVKREIAVHELLHLSVDPCYLACAETIDELTDGNPIARRLVKEPLHQKREAVVADLELIVLRLLPAAFPTATEIITAVTRARGTRIEMEVPAFDSPGNCPHYAIGENQ